MKQIYLSLRILLVYTLLLPLSLEAQITITPSITAAALANKLAGPGVLILAPKLTCPSNANGTFKGVSSLGFDSGIVLTTGTACTGGISIGAGGFASAFASTDNMAAGDAQLSALAGLPTFDACVLEFDFKPAGDTVKFNYVFGSEEYPGFTCTSFNDVFGFFISGPGYATPKNIALVPGTNIPVCINSVNCGPTGSGMLSSCTMLGAGSPFCAYFVNNSSGTTITYDGLTTKLTAIASVAPCDTYHLKIGIADGTDHVLDSGVFLEAGSLTSTGISVNPMGINSNDTGAQFCVRGCLPGKFVFTRTSGFSNSLTIHFLVAGTAINGSDYTKIADSVILGVNDTTGSVLIHALPVLPTGTKTIKLYVVSPYNCGGIPIILDSATLDIYDSFNVHINTPDTAICQGQSVLIKTSGYPSLNYSWSPAISLNCSTLMCPLASPSVTTTYVLTSSYPVTGCAPSTSHLTVTVYNRPVPYAGPDRQTTCLHVPLQLSATAMPAGVPYTYSWSPATYLDNPNIANPIVSPGVAYDQEYYVTVSPPAQGCSTIDSFLLHVVPADFNLYSKDSLICYPPGSFQINADGTTEFTYRWIPATGVSNPNIINPVITPYGDGTYSLTASYPNCPDVTHTIKYTVEQLFGDILITDSAFCIGSPIPIPVVVTPENSDYTFSWYPTDGIVDPSKIEASFFKNEPGVYKYYLTVRNQLGCESTDSVVFRPQPPIHIGVTPGETTITLGGQVQLNAINYTPAAGNLRYEWIPNDGTLNNPGCSNPIAAPFETTTYTVVAMSVYGCFDTATETIDVDFSNECIPSAFTPNGDGRNDVFRLCNPDHQKLIQFTVFNRWGQVVYENHSDPSKGWDGFYNGVLQDVGVYNYMIIIAHPNGHNKMYKGDVTLIK